MHLAFLILSGRSKVDPATLYFASEHSSNGVIDFTTMRRVSSNPSMYREWVVLRDGLISEMSKQQDFALNSDSVDPILVQEYITQRGKHYFNSCLVRNLYSRNWIFENRIQSCLWWGCTRTYFFGKENSDFLKVFLNKSVSEQVEKQFKMNYSPSVWLYALQGQTCWYPAILRAFCNSWNFMETNSKHGVEIVMSLLSNFFYFWI